VGARTDAARAEVVARREELLHEVTCLEAAGRSAVDIPAKVRHSPGKTAALAAGTAFIALGGPKRTYRAVRKAVFGPDADLPKSMLPEQIDKALRALGTDGDRVRRVVEHEFADYLEKNKQARESRDFRGTVTELGGNLLRPVSVRAGRRLAEELFKPDGGSFNEVMSRIQSRRDARHDAAGPDKRDAAAKRASSGREAGVRGRWRARARKRD
jgi:hypothetical protein